MKKGYKIMVKHIAINPETGLYDYIGHFESIDAAIKKCSWNNLDEENILVGKDADKTYKKIGDANKKLKRSLKEALLKAELSKAFVDMLNTTSIKKQIKRKYK